MYHKEHCQELHANQILISECSSLQDLLGHAQRLRNSTLRVDLPTHFLSHLNHPFLPTWVVAEEPSASQAPIPGTAMLAMVRLQV